MPGFVRCLSTSIPSTPPLVRLGLALAVVAAPLVAGPFIVPAHAQGQDDTTDQPLDQTPPTGTAAPTAATAPGAAPGATTAPAVAAVRTETSTSFKSNSSLNSYSTAKVTLPLNLIWRYTADEPPFAATGSPLVVGPPALRRIIISTGNFIAGIDANNGTQLWKFDAGGVVRSPLALLQGSTNGDVVLGITTSGRLHALRASDGSEVWAAETRSPVGGVGPVVVKSSKKTRILVPVAAGRIIAFSQDGALDPDFEVKLGRSSASPASTPALSADGRTLFIAGLDRNLYAVDTESGEIIWTSPLRGIAYYSPAVMGDTVVINAGTDLVAYYANDGQSKWRITLPAQSLISPGMSPTGGSGNKGLVFTGTTRGQFSAYSTDDGAEVWKQDLEASVTGSPLVLQNMVLVGTRNGLLCAMDPKDGKLLWRYRMQTERTVVPQTTTNTNNNRGGRGNFGGPGGPGGPGGRGGFGRTQTAAPETRTFGISSAPAAVDGQVYLTADNSALYALDVTPFDAEPPLATEAAVSVSDAQGKLVPQLLGGRRPVIVPGKAPVYFAVILSDPGSGVDPDSIKVTLNNNPIDAKQIYFQASSGNLTCVMADADPNKTVLLPDGVYNIAIVARDYRNNVLTYKTSFTVDKSVPPPTAQNNTRGNRGGRGGRGNPGFGTRGNTPPGPQIDPGGNQPDDNPFGGDPFGGDPFGPGPVGPGPVGPGPVGPGPVGPGPVGPGPVGPGPVGPGPVGGPDDFGDGGNNPFGGGPDTEQGFDPANTPDADAG